MSELQTELALFEGEIPLFEQQGRPNGFTTWSARALAEGLGYPDFASFRPVIAKAQQVLLTLEIEVTEHFNQEEVIDERGRPVRDVRLTRFACYLVAMNGDVKKKRVAQAQVYFARFNEECQRNLDDAEAIERVLVRKEVSKHEVVLAKTARRAGVVDFAAFKNAGYRGLYNMNIAELRARKGVPEDQTPLDFMGKVELAANLFRITQTDVKIKTFRVRGQDHLEATAEGVGRQVRKAMHEISGQRPEDLHPQEDIVTVRRGLKSSGKALKHSQPSDLKALPPPESYLEAPEESEGED